MHRAAPDSFRPPAGGHAALLALSAAAQEKKASAFAVGDGHCVSVHQAVADSSRVCSQTVHGQVAEASVVAIDAACDLALLHSLLTTPPLPNAATAPLTGGMPLLTVGYPDPYRFGDDPKVRRSRLEAVGGIFGEAGRLQVSVPVWTGSSGAPSLGPDSRVVGLIHRLGPRRAGRPAARQQRADRLCGRARPAAVADRQGPCSRCRPPLATCSRPGSRGRRLGGPGHCRPADRPC